MTKYVTVPVEPTDDETTLRAIVKVLHPEWNEHRQPVGFDEAKKILEVVRNLNFVVKEMESINSVAQAITYDGCMHNKRKTCYECTKVIIEKFVEQLLSFSSAGSGTCTVCSTATAVMNYGRLKVCFECYYKGDAKALLLRLNMALDLLDEAKCPNCDGSGGVPRQIGPDDWELEQCQWCDEKQECFGKT